MTREDILVAVVAELGEPANGDTIIGESHDLFEDLYFDSLEVIELVLAMEEMFEIEITDDEADVIRTVGDVVDIIAAKLATAAK